MTTEPDAAPDELGVLLEFLKEERGFDFTGYKRSSIERRVTKRMEAVGCPSYAAYVDHLQVTPDEFAELFNTILINVTSFLRDPAAWTFLDEHVIAPLAEQSDIRIWSAGCATGEEPYTLAMLLVRALGPEAFKERVKIYATDIDDEALMVARHGAYSRDALSDVPGDLVEACFERQSGRFAFRRDLRRSLIFGRNDLVQDAPISRLDLLVCRNTLMYFTAETQAQVLARFHFAVRDSGHLFLGKSEMLLTHGELFAPLELQHRVFRKVGKPSLRERLGAITAEIEGVPVADDTPAPVRDGAFELTPVPQIVVERSGALFMANAAARALFGIPAGDLGRPLQDLEVSYRPVELRAAIEQAYRDRAPIALGAASWRPGAPEERRLEVQVSPIFVAAGDGLGALVTFTDVTEHARLVDEVDGAKRELEVAYEELQSTVEELETTNEELQSTNEELETTNEELQSTNEELETTNEELQSTNEELETMNDELRGRTTELDSVNASFEAILRSLRVGVAVVDGGGVVRIWNALSQELWGLRSEEAVGQHAIGLDIGLPMEPVSAPLHAALRGETPQSLVLDATNRRGRPMRCRVTALPIASDGRPADGAILLMEDVSE
jgi:two-component system CheB/CheR fusion protein